MVSRGERHAPLIASGLGLCGAAAGLAWRHGLWLALSGAILLLLWLAVTNFLLVRRGGTTASAHAAAGVPDEVQMTHHLLLDASPTPLVLVTGTTASALNRAARRIFPTTASCRRPRHCSIVRRRICAMLAGTGAPTASMSGSAR